MSLLNKVEAYQREGFGVVVFTQMRLPFRLFSRKPDKLLFKPDFPSAKFYELDDTKLDAEKFFELENAFQAMAYIRSTQEL